MPHRSLRLPGLLGAALLAVAPFAPALAAPPPPPPPSSPVHSRTVVTHGVVVINGHRIRYKATTGTLIMRNSKLQPIASIFYVAYTRDGVRNEEDRPITFAYNGGPGSSSVWLHMGGIGPRRVVVPSNAQSVPNPPYDITNNPYSILNATDLVFIDPVGTGYSHVIGKTNPKMFWGVQQDARSVGAFIMRYLTKFNRWNSPKFLLGESYGTTRSAVLSNYLQDHGVQLNGVMLLSSILNFETAAFDPGNNLPYVLYLPSEAAVSWYHHRIHPRPKNLPAFLKKVERFAIGPYNHALMLGAMLPAAEKQAVIQKLVAYTGIPAHTWRLANLRITGFEFQALLLRNEHEQTGRLDARYANYNFTPLFPYPDYSVMTAAIDGAFTGAFNWYVRNDLHYRTKRHYDILNYQVIRNWNWHSVDPLSPGGGGWPGYTDVAPDLARALVTNPHMQLLVNSGYFDLGTPFFATIYTMEHLNLPPAIQKHVHFAFYYCGHMLYLHQPSLAELHRNLVNFIRMAAPGSH
jgi:carboxypeptidase C (cathepsin A)